MNKQINNLLFLMIAFTFVSCSQWLEVTPKTEIKVKSNFENELGFKDALTGIYVLMTSEGVYGRELSYGMTDVLSRQVSQVSSTYSEYYSISTFDYENETAITKFDQVWREMYNIIANLNVLIENIEKADTRLFTANNYSIIKGEAYALRAFIHFDLLRLFAPSYKVGKDKAAIPYVVKPGKELTKFSTVSEVIELTLKDLVIAQKELEKDPVNVLRGESYDDEVYTRNRGLKFNYYAVKLLEARINLYKENYVEALKAAQVVISQDRFTWTPSSEITGDVSNRNCIFSEEVIFALNINNLSDLYTEWFTSKNALMKENFEWSETFQVSTPGFVGDYRYQYLSDFNSAEYKRYSLKLLQGASMNSDYLKKLPIMRISEAYYIAAECQLKTDGTGDAINTLEIVRGQRNIENRLEANLSPDDVQTEIGREYAKEFMCEGQMFYYYKRLNATKVQFIWDNFDTKLYILPIPLDEMGAR